MPKYMKICLAASAGGHLTQLLMLKNGWSDHNTFFVTTSDVVLEKLQKYGKVYVVGECNRQHLLKVLLVSIRCIRIILKERPDVVISTGAAVGCIMCFLGKITGAKIIWVDSITNVEKLSLSGRLVRHITDLFLTQWQQLAKQYKNVEYAGMII
jgi:UDP-N-acetylglucosamine:LPS N-acetylglucosamine transferase